MRSGPYLEIVLDRPELLIRGSFDEATPTLLSGRLVVHLNEPIRVRSLKMLFTGRLDTYLNQSVVGANITKDEHREILAHEWQFLEPQKPSVTWGPENMEFPFDLLVQGDNPETVLTALGKIRYHLHATLERTSFHMNLTASVDVPVKRGPVPGAPWALALMESIEAAGEWDQQLDYRVSVPTRSLKDGELFHTRFELEPRVKGMKLIAAGVLVKEYIRYYSSSGQPLHKLSRVIARNENYLDRSGTCSTIPRNADNCMDLLDATSVQIPLAIPEAYGGTQYDVMTDLIEIRHRIKFLIKIRDPFLLVHSIFIAVPVSIMPVTARDDTNLLPRYEAALHSPGTVLMRSGTQPPAYDTISIASGVNEANSNSGGGGGDSAEGTPAVQQGAVVDGFPGPLHRCGSQFYLASPDHSPAMRPRDSDASRTSQGPGAHSEVPSPPSLDISGSSGSSSTGRSSDSTIASVPAIQAYSNSAADTPEVIARRTNSDPYVGNGDIAISESRTSSVHRPQSIASISSSRFSVHEMLAGNKITEKMRSIFNSNLSSSSTSSGVPADEVGGSAGSSMPPTPVPPHANISAGASSELSARRCSVPALAPPMPVHTAPSRHMHTSSFSLFGGLGQPGSQGKKNNSAGIRPSEMLKSQNGKHVASPSPMALQ